MCQLFFLGGSRRRIVEGCRGLGWRTEMARPECVLAQHEHRDPTLYLIARYTANIVLEPVSFLPAYEGLYRVSHELADPARRGGPLAVFSPLAWSPRPFGRRGQCRRRRRWLWCRTPSRPPWLSACLSASLAPPRRSPSSPVARPGHPKPGNAPPYSGGTRASVAQTTCSVRT